MKEKKGLNFSKKAIDLRERLSSRIILRTAIVFILSMLLYLFTDTYPITALAGFVAIISGAIMILFVIIFLIFFFLERMKYSKGESVKKRIVAKKTVRERTVKKKVAVKKMPVKKKVVRKRIKK